LKYITIHINGIKSLAMLDSGATRTVVRAGESFLADLPCSSANVTLVTSDNSKMSASKLVSLPIEFTNRAKAKINAIIVDRLATPLILGLDFIKSLQFSDDSTFVHLNGHHLRLNDPSFSAKQIRSLNTLVVEPYAIVLIEPLLPHDLVGTFSVESQCNHRNRSYEILPSITTSSNPSPIFLKNNTDRFIKITKRERIALAHPINLSCNAITEVTDLEKEDALVEEFQLEREEKAENVMFEPNLKSYGSLKGDELDQMKDLVQENKLAFQINDNDLGRCARFRFTLPLLDESETAHQPPRPVPVGLKKKVSDELEKWKTLGMIDETQSGFNIPLLILRKPDGSIRVSLDARLINTKLQQDRFPLPAIPDVFSKISERINQSEKCFISTVDFARSYNQIQIDDKDCHNWHFRMKGSICNLHAYFTV